MTLAKTSSGLSVYVPSEQKKALQSQGFLLAGIDFRGASELVAEPDSGCGVGFLEARRYV